MTSYFSFVFLRSSFHPPGTVFFVTSFRSWFPFFFILSPIIILFLSVIVSMSSSPDSMYSASLGVDSGTISILLVMRSSSWLSFLFSSLFGFLVSPAYVIMGIMQADTSFQNVSMWMFLKWQSPAITSIAWYAASTFPSICFSWSLRLSFSLTISPRYLYFSVGSTCICPRVSLGCSLVLPMVRDWLFSFPNLMYFSATFSVMSSNFCFSFGFVSSSSTSSIHSRHAIFVGVSGISIPRSVSCISLFISSMRRAYCRTDSTPPCRMLSLIVIFLVGPYLVWMFAVRFSFSFLMICQSFEFTPLLYMTYSMASIHALS